MSLKFIALALIPIIQTTVLSQVVIHEQKLDARVVDIGSMPIQDASIMIRGMHSSWDTTVYSNHDGRFAVNLPAEENFRIWIRTERFKTLTAKIEVSNADKAPEITVFELGHSAIKDDNPKEIVLVGSGNDGSPPQSAMFEIPEFPNKVPRPGSKKTLPYSAMHPENTFKDVSKQLEKRLNSCGYHDLAYFGFRSNQSPTWNGFVILTEMEKFNPEDGKYDPDGRFARRTRKKYSSFWDYIKSFISANNSTYRMFAFLISEGGFQESDSDFKKEDAESLFSSGVKVKLPKELQDLEFTEEHIITVLLYEFQFNEDEEISLTFTSDIDVLDQLSLIDTWEWNQQN